MINVKLKFFGPLRELAGEQEAWLELPDHSTGEDAFARIAAKHPGINKWRNSVRLAVNLEYAGFNRELRAGDEISFIPPVSGG